MTQTENEVVFAVFFSIEFTLTLSGPGQLSLGLSLNQTITQMYS